MSFHKQPFAARFQAMGDESEGYFERLIGKVHVRFGLNRPPISLKNIPERIRSMPDYLCSDRMYEVKGMGRDDTLKLKVSDYQVLTFWHQVMPLSLWVWSSYRFAYAEHDLLEIRAMIDGGLVGLDRFDNDNKAYFAIPGSALTWTEVERV